MLGTVVPEHRRVGPRRRVGVAPTLRPLGPHRGVAARVVGEDPLLDLAVELVRVRPSPGR